MLIVDIDTVLQKQSVAKMEQACNSMDSALSATQKVRQHNDWHCAERDRINQDIADIHNAMKRMRDNTYSFANTLKDAANELAAQENSIIHDIGGIDSIIADITNLIPGYKPGFKPTHLPVHRHDLYPSIQEMINQDAINKIKEFYSGTPNWHQTPTWFHPDHLHAITITKFPDVKK